MGLLNIEDPQSAGLLGLGLGLLGSRGSFAQALSQGLLSGAQMQGQAQRAKDEKRKDAQREEMLALQLDQMRRQIAQEREWQDALKSSFRTPSQQALSAGGGLTMQNAQAMDAARPTFDYQQLMGVDPVRALELQSKMSKPTEQPMKLGTSERLIDPRTGRVLVAASEEKKPPSDVQLYEYAKAQGYGGSLMQFLLDQRRAGASNTQVSYGAPVAGVDANGNPVFFQPNKTGGTPAIIPGVAPPKNEKQLTEGQAKGALYLGQMRSASAELEKLPTASPVAVAATESPWTNWAASANTQKVAQAQNQWSEAYLRTKTGAAATPGEVELNRRTFFPVIGDKPEQIQQKRLMRQQAERDMEPVAGPGAARAGGGTRAAVTVGGQTYARPAGMTDQQWADYKKAMGVE